MKKMIETDTEAPSPNKKRNKKNPNIKLWAKT